MQDGSVRLRTAVYDLLVRAKGHKSVVSQARLHGLSRSSMFRLRGGGEPSAEVCLRMAADLVVAVEVIWERLP